MSNEKIIIPAHISIKKYLLGTKNNDEVLLNEAMTELKVNGNDPKLVLKLTQMLNEAKKAQKNGTAAEIYAKWEEEIKPYRENI